MDNKNSIQTISVHELKKVYDNPDGIHLIDVRELDEWNEHHIPGAIHIPKDILPTVIQETIPQHTQTIYLHCRGGVRSLHAANCLLEMGYQKVYSVDGGIIEWINAGYPVQSTFQK